MRVPGALGNVCNAKTLWRATRDDGGPSFKPHLELERRRWSLENFEQRINPTTPPNIRRGVADGQLSGCKCPWSCQNVLISTVTMSSTIPRFFSQPFRYLRWASIEKPAIFYSIVIGSLGPVVILVVPPIRHRFGDPQRPQIPLTYPSTFVLQRWDHSSMATFRKLTGFFFCSSFRSETNIRRL